MKSTKERIEGSVSPYKHCLESNEGIIEIAVHGECDYTKEFSSLMLEIKNHLFNFISGLLGWAQTEIRRQCVKNLQFTLVAAESLINFRGNEANLKKNDETSNSKKKRQGQESRG